MQRVFTDSFDVGSWLGVRATEFEMPFDAFQQLVGDGLKAEFGANAWVASTKGRDGSIDAWVDRSPAVPLPFPKLGDSFIVECKWHDATAKDPKGNIEQQWRRVAAKLKDQAANGWPGAYAPWKNANGYLYCVSLRFPDQAFRENLRDTIRDFFDTLPIAQRPPIPRDAIHVWDWADLAGWLRGFARLADFWLGLPDGDLFDHASYRRRIGHREADARIGFRGYLLDENLPFVPPAENDESHPGRLFERLCRSENLLLLGEGGIGKTRTAFEVAERAHRAGWRVLHLDPPEGGIDPRALLGELASPGNTLVVVDYVDKIQNFDARYWRHTLLPEVAEHGGRLRLIANARPADSESLLAAIHESGLFASVGLAPNAERRTAVANAIEHKLCPRALALLGAAQVRELCGSRPIIAMFVARELEALADAGQLASGLENAPRPGDLVGWLSRRLAGTELLYRPTGSRWDTALPAPGLCAAVAALAAAPMAETELIQVAAATLTAAGADPANASRCIALLRHAGWLELDAREFIFRTPHDIVCDETLSRLLVAADKTLPWLLSGAVQGRPLGRFALSLGRLHGNRLLDDHQIAQVQCWLETEAAGLGIALTSSRTDVAAYALGAVLDCPYWTETATAQWSALVAPWLRAFGADLSARHLLHRGLKMPAAPNELGNAALAWLNRHGETEIAGFVLAPLLAWDADRLGARQNDALDAAFAWLGNHGATEAAEFVLHPLLAWDADRLGARQNDALDATFAWLGIHGAAETAGYVLPPLLDLDADRVGTRQKEALGASFAWLGIHGEAEAAQFVLKPLLAWDADHLGTLQNDALGTAFAWLRIHGAAESAQFVLKPLLAWDADRLGARQNDALDAAFAWLGSHGAVEAAQFVLTPLLAWDADRLGARQNDALDAAFAWLGNHGATEAAGFVLTPLLAWDADRLGARQNDALDAAFTWLGNHGATEVARFVLNPLLAWDADRLGNRADKLISSVLAWLATFHSAESADFVLVGVLDRRQPDDSARRQCAAWAMAWLDRHIETGDATHLFNTLLKTANWHAESVDVPRIIKLAGLWLDRHPTHVERRFVMARLLRLPELPDRAWLGVAARALEELNLRAGDTQDDYILSSVPVRLAGLRKEHRDLWLRLTQRWILHHGTAKAIGRLIWDCQKKSSRLVDAYVESLMSDCRQRFGPDFEVGP